MVQIDKQDGEKSKQPVIFKNKHNPEVNEIQTSKKDNNGKLEIVEEFSLPMTKKSLRNKPFVIIEPDNNKIMEPNEKSNPILPEEKKKPEIEREQGEECGDHNADSMIANAKVITLTVLDSHNIKTGTTLQINAAGLINSNRKAQDGRVYFGTYSGHDPTQINDYIVPGDEKGFGKRHFMIEYDLGKKEYFLRDLGDGTGTFVKITTKTILRNNTTISIGTMYLLILFPPNQSKSGTEINPKIISTEPLRW